MLVFYVIIKVEIMKLKNYEYKIIVESSPNMIWRAGTDTLCNYFNTTWLKFTGRSMDEEMGNGWTIGIHPDDFNKCLTIYLDSFKQQISFEMEYRLKRYDGVYRWINDRGTPLFLEDSTFIGYIGSCMDVSDKIEGQHLRELAQKDGLTNIFNRQHFEHLGNIEFTRAKRFNSALSLVIIDIDAFKRINDTFGHLAGDIVLKEVGITLSKNIREFDILARFGGDEFVLLMPNTDLSSASILVKRLENAINDLFISYEGININITASFGISQLDEEEKFELILRNADKHLYEKKRLIHI